MAPSWVPRRVGNPEAVGLSLARVQDFNLHAGQTLTFTDLISSGPVSIAVLCVGAGGGAGGSASQLDGGHGGGGGGSGSAALARLDLTAADIAEVTWTIGSGGEGHNAGDNSQASDGSDTIFAVGGVSKCLAKGGGGGFDGHADIGAGGGGGGGLGGLQTDCTGDVCWGGGNGGDGSADSGGTALGGGGGSGATYNKLGGSGTGIAGGAALGGYSTAGANGGGSTNGYQGQNGTGNVGGTMAEPILYSGSGGGGGGSHGATVGNGGFGAGGYILIWKLPAAGAGAGPLPPQPAAGPASLVIQGSGQSVDFSNYAPVLANSVSLWVKVLADSPTGPIAYQGSADNYATPGNWDWGFFFSSSHIAVYTQDGSNIWTRTDPVLVPAAWVNYVLVRSDSGTAKLYRNGVLLDSSVSGGASTSTNKLQVGYAPATGNAHFELADLCLYGSALSADDAAVIYSGDIPGSNGA